VIFIPHGRGRPGTLHFCPAAHSVNVELV